MSDVLTPQLAVRYLRELQPALTGLAIFDHEGSLLAGEDVERGADVERGSRDHVADVTARGERYSIRATAPSSSSGAIELPALTNLDLDTALADLK